mmetsp:Transcript_51285/g.81385  ORF Transcript_51285/g.81385 Transcript_51285/m.81385 type:complete len:90 (-) Transcript_51285:198-467(-)
MCQFNDMESAKSRAGRKAKSSKCGSIVDHILKLSLKSPKCERECSSRYPMKKPSINMQTVYGSDGKQRERNVVVKAPKASVTKRKRTAT